MDCQFLTKKAFCLILSIAANRNEQGDVRDLRGLELCARRFHLLDLTGRTGLDTITNNLRL